MGSRAEEEGDITQDTGEDTGEVRGRAAVPEGLPVKVRTGVEGRVP